MKRKDLKKLNYCSKHAPDGYIDIRSKKCLKCNICASYGKEGSNIREYCFEHKPDDYINVKK